MICPKCKLEQPDGSIECAGCGIVFNKYTAPSDKRPGLILSSTVPCPDSGILITALSPLAKAKTFIQAIYDRILSMIWEELMGVDVEYTQTAQFIAFLIFSLISILFYRFGKYGDLVIFGLFFIWLTDCLLARRRFLYSEKFEKIILKDDSDGRFAWKRAYCEDEEAYEIVFSVDEIKNIVIHQTIRRGGAFQEIMGVAWQVQIHLKDHTSMLICEETHVEKALRKAKRLSSKLKVSVKFTNSSGRNPMTMKGPSGRVVMPETIHIKRESQKLHIYSLKGFSGAIPLIRRVLREAGFFLFLIILAGVMVRWGRFLEWFIGPYIGLKPTVLHIQLGFWSVWGMFRPEIDWTTGLEITLAAGLMIAQFVRLNKRASFEIDSRFVRIYFGEEQGYDLKIKTMEYPIFISKPVPVVLMLDNRQVVEIEDLHSEEEYLAIMRGIEEGIERYDKV